MSLKRKDQIQFIASFIKKTTPTSKDKLQNPSNQYPNSALLRFHQAESSFRLIEFSSPGSVVIELTSIDLFHFALLRFVSPAAANDGKWNLLLYTIRASITRRAKLVEACDHPECDLGQVFQRPGMLTLNWSKIPFFDEIEKWI